MRISRRSFRGRSVAGFRVSIDEPLARRSFASASPRVRLACLRLAARVRLRNLGSLAGVCGRVDPGWEGDEGCALVYRYVWRDDLSDTFDESVRV